MATTKKAPSSAKRASARPRPAPDGAAEVDAYVAARPPAARKQLERIRRILRKALPGAVEGIAYGTPAFKVEGSPAMYFAAWQEHYAIYPGSARILASLQAELGDLDVSKGTLRFPLGKAIPAALLARIAALRTAEIAERLAAKKRKKTKAAGAKKKAASKR